MDTTHTPWKLWLDDKRPPSPGFLCAISSTDALLMIEARGMPLHMSLDHDLGGDDTGMILLKRMAQRYPCPFLRGTSYAIHSANVVGRENLYSFIESWKRSEAVEVIKF